MPDRQVKPKSGEPIDPKLPPQSPSKEKDKNKKEIVQKNTFRLEIPYEVGVLFKPGENTHNHEGKAINLLGTTVFDMYWDAAKEIMENNGEEEFLKFVAKDRVENHLIPKYREKFEELKKAGKLPVPEEYKPAVPNVPKINKPTVQESEADFDIPF